MTLNERILEFMDGSLHPNDEAELLHTLSVSPEKRNVLRDFMNQKSLLSRDRESIAVPYEAEQSLWASVDAILPATSSTVAPQPVALMQPAAAGFFSRMMTASAAAVGALGLLIGIGSGYFAATQPVNVNMEATRALPSAPKIASVSASSVQHSSPTWISAASDSPIQPMSPLGMEHFGLASLFSSAAASESLPQSAEAPIAYVQPRDQQPEVLHSIGTDGGIAPQFHNTPIAEPRRSLLERFEFHVSESFGRQFPNSAATNVSLPLMTNSSVGTYFQVLPHSNVLWAGADYGTANVTRKGLFTHAGNPIDPLQNVLAGDTVHEQISYMAALAQLRFPSIAGAELTFTGGYGFGSLGQMMIGELGFHYDLTHEVGLVTGLRVVRFSYDLTADKNAAIHSGAGSLVVPNGVGDAAPSLNLELNTGLYFHF
ncbi:MAG: hypothetical protein Q8913_01255 [Bacteroidota bacterium]|nr:hypothetical protein [Bacteroidota bacterium]